MELFPLSMKCLVAGIMPRNWDQPKEASPLSTRMSSKIPANADTRRLRYPGRVNSKSRTRRSTSRGRRSRSPRHKKSLSPPPKRRVPTPDKRPTIRNNRSDSRQSQKRPRLSPRNRIKTPPPRRISRDRPSSYSLGKEPNTDKPRSSQLSSMSKRDEITDRYDGGGKYVVDRPLFRGPEKHLLHDRDNLKKIVVNMRDIPPGNDTVKRNIVSPDDINVSRRAVTARGSRDYREMDNGRMSRPIKYDLSPPVWNQRCFSYGRTVNQDESSRYTSEGTRPLYDREEVVNHRRKFEENERDRRRGGVVSSAMHSDRRHLEPNGSSENFRSRNPYYDDERAPRGREYPLLRPSPREYDSRGYDKLRDDRPREELRFMPPATRPRSRSYERSRDPLERKERYDERDGHRMFRRSLERLPPDDRLLRRHPSPGETRRHFDDYRIINDRRERSVDRRDFEQLHYRDHDFPPSDRFTGSDYLPKSHGYYENELRGNRMLSPVRGRGRPVSYRGRGVPSSRTFPRSTDPVM